MRRLSIRVAWVLIILADLSALGLLGFGLYHAARFMLALI